MELTHMYAGSMNVATALKVGASLQPVRGSAAMNTLGGLQEAKGG